ncbi:hypothetical protein, partial [Acinetobacter baumannii]|uniref:hypothetical protein n=1 Tax=Acinetobacter baumannii TaxID=470 RepID=UPI001C09351F
PDGGAANFRARSSAGMNIDSAENRWIPAGNARSKLPGADRSRTNLVNIGSCNALLLANRRLQL